MVYALSTGNFRVTVTSVDDQESCWTLQDKALREEIRSDFGLISVYCLKQKDI
jgi:hypothetical protein